MKTKNQIIQKAAAKCVVIHNQYEEADQEYYAVSQKLTDINEDWNSFDDEYNATLDYIREAHDLGSPKKRLITKARILKKKITKLEKLYNAQKKAVDALDKKRDGIYDKFSNSGLPVAIAACMEMARLEITNPSDKRLKQLGISEEFAALISRAGAKAALSFCK